MTVHFFARRKRLEPSMLVGFVAFGAVFNSVRKQIADWAIEETERFALWVPVAIGLGAGGYFALKVEPPIWVGPIFLISFYLFSRLSEIRRRFWLALMLTAIGFCAADIRTELVRAPVLEKELPISALEGRLVSVEEGPNSRRLIIVVDGIEGVPAEATPRRARVTWRGKSFNAKPGDTLRLLAGLSPPPPPAAPGTYDFARQLYFERIGAVGFVVRKPEVLSENDPTYAQKASAWIERIRLGLFHRITAAAPGDGGAIVAAVVTGKREAISPSAEAALRDAGLAHLLAISGLHMGLATGLIFFTVRLGLALIEPVALRFAIKKWAAAAALLSGAVYLIISGAGWSARRAFVMTAIIFLAVLVDRRALSLRNVAIAASLILLMTPEALLHPGFQMSFAAVTALIAAYEWAAYRRGERIFTLVARVRRYAIGIIFTDLIAAIATAPYALFHFNRAAIYSLPANFIAMPLMGLVIMPAAILALFLSPLGADAWAWRLSAAGVEAVLSVGGEVSSWPGAVSVTSQWPVFAMVVLTFGGLWLCLMRARWRWGGLLALPVVLVSTAVERPPDIFVSASGLNTAVVTFGDDGARVFSVYEPRREKFAAGVWKEAAGFDPDRTNSEAMATLGQCDPSGCTIVSRTSARIAVSRAPIGLAQDCNRADVVIAVYPVSGPDWRACRAVLVDRGSSWRRGAHALWLNKNGAVRVRTTSAARGRRPWTGRDSVR